MLFLLTILSGVAQGAPDSPPETALADYVAQPDSTYEWHVQARYFEQGAEIVELSLQSQTWRGIPWKHRLYVIKPESGGTEARQGLLIVGGGRWRERDGSDTRDQLPEDAEVFIGIANRLDTIVAVLGQVPFQPMFDLTEDKLIAFTFEQYLLSGDAEWPLLLPMVKSAVRAMDTTQAFVSEEWSIALEEFTVVGGSKRGWTTWLTGVVDSRATILVPLVIDALNFAKHMPYQTAIWGAPSEELAPYSELGLLDILGSEEGAALRTIVDPYSYRDRLTQLKLVVASTNDTYFPLDAMNLYWNDLPPPKYPLYLPNEGHSIENLGRVLAALNAVHRSVDIEAELPSLAWQFEKHETALRLCLRADPAPAAVAAWTAEAADADFREAEFAATSVAVRDGVYIFDLALPLQGFKAVFAESAFDSGGVPYSLSTNVRIVDPRGEAPTEATAIAGESGVCP